MSCNSGKAVDLPEGGSARFKAEDLLDAIGFLKSLGVPREIASVVERVYRKEAGAKLDSRQYRVSGSPGMVAQAAEYPWGWHGLARGLWKDFPGYRPILRATFNTREGCLSYLGFKSVRHAVAAFVARMFGYPVPRVEGDVFYQAAGWFRATGPGREEYANSLRRLTNPYTARVYGGSDKEVYDG